MDQVDLLAELEAMAFDVEFYAEENTISNVDIERWQRLFGYTHQEASQCLEEYHNDYSRSRIPDSLWETVRPYKEAEGYDRQAYEYSLTQRVRSQPQASLVSAGHEPTTGEYIVQLVGPLGTPEIIQNAAGLAEIPPILPGIGELGTAAFCQIDAGARGRLIVWVAEHHPGFQPMIVQMATRAKKNVCPTGITPFLGMATQSVLPSPTHDQYPVWYFFYGTLADPEILARQLELSEEPVLIPAHVEGGRIRTWGGKYKALVDGADQVFGRAFLVDSREQEDSLRLYETDKYEVVRCNIISEDRRMDGLTFRFAGSEEELT